MSYIDLHCDTLMQAVLRQKRDLYAFPSAMVDLRRLEAAGCMAQFFAVFLPSPSMLAHYFPRYAGDDAYIAACRRLLLESLARRPETAAFARSGADLLQNTRRGKVSCFLTIEDGRSVSGKLEKLEGYFDLGVRLITLTWNAPNCFGFPSSDSPELMARGLTVFGREAVERMGELGMLVDVSHLSDGGFWDVAELCKGPFVASHSNARALCPHRRNLTDKMLRALGDHGGVAGLNLAPFFVSPEGKSTAAGLARHARHMADKGGLEAVSLGTDFDGVDGDMEMDSVHKLYLLWDALRDEGFSEDDVDRISHGNALRVIQEVLK